MRDDTVDRPILAIGPGLNRELFARGMSGWQVVVVGDSLSGYRTGRILTLIPRVESVSENDRSLAWINEILRCRLKPGGTFDGVMLP